MDECWVLEAGCFSTHADINSKTGQMWGVESDRVYTSYMEMLAGEQDQLDAVAVLTPTPSHAEIVTTTLKYGYPVICEKALAASSDEIKSIIHAVEEYSGYLAITYNYTGYPMVRELQRITQSGGLGQLQQINIEMPQEGFLRLDENGKRSEPQAWRLRDGVVPTISLDLGVHLHQMIKFLSGERPVELVAINNKYGLFDEIIDNTMCIARYSRDIDCQIWFGKTALGNSNGLRVRLYGDKGSAEWYQMQPETLIIHDNKGRKTILERSSVDLILANDRRYNRFKAGHPAGFIEAFANLYYDIAMDIHRFKIDKKSNSPWVFGADVALEGLEMLETMEQSAIDKEWKTVQSIDYIQK
ncbi:MAG: Gfo/Idh/MocA family oxidoreductase [Candidatus Thiodiazotropha sp. (ex Lucina pensylvanica)]|nr:Gfo/Idh/MocA family oxidoreductase [Candidatus Thiodiazotropha sp. (ex Lucina pensylvanica)]MBT3051064.1 Gfo/Idh/MocA family oxidoreductase [Candidatus Thiodiazotropha sp. (ex Codakia orbicularis)]